MWLLRGGSVTPFSTRFLSSRLVNFGLPFERCRLVLPCCCSLWFCSACLNCATGSSTRRQRLSFLRFSEEATDGNRLLLVVWGVFLPSRWMSRLRGASQCREIFLPWDFLRGSVSSLSLQVMERALDWLIAVISFLSFRSSAWYEVLTDFFTWTVSVLLEIVQGLWSDFLTVWVLYPSPLAFDA